MDFLRGSRISQVSVPILSTTVAIGILVRFGVLKMLTLLELEPIYGFSTNCFLILPIYWAGVPACGSGLFSIPIMKRQLVSVFKKAVAPYP